MYLTGRNPDGIVVTDLTDVVDDDAKEITWFSPYGVLPMQDMRDDAGAATQAAIGGAGMALSTDNRYLLAAHHRGNGVAIFDLDLGAVGAEVAWLSHVGENPHLIRVSPDGRHAVVANYVGDVASDGLATSSTLAIIDLDPDSPTFLEVVTWLANK
jgi:DNA-binding beta-propeller fold protein YncE